MLPSITTLPLLLLASILPPTHAQPACNGHPALCARQYSNITQIGTHDSAFIGALPQDNQDQPLTTQLNAGIRFLQAQTHVNPFGTLSLCHTSCYLLDAGSLTSYLSTVKTWLDANPSEPRPLHLTAWPTLQDLITANTRLVFFLDYGASPPTYPYILDEFAYFFETPYDTTDPAFAECTLDRPPDASPDGRMYIINHFLDVSFLGVEVPDNAADATTNAATGVGSVGAQADLCVGMYGRAPKGVLVDFWEKGSVLEAQDRLNGV
ncbi:MAG: hypothetical protein FRX48_06661 [Lasallia pustulata]|uniref:PLC-like phosphodiesterase, TIM beta/alpha-barrel domain n=1 Tax=Lasallia pustulata TaxID=136370 RepID=A0A5M8PKU4_9LECA|nr:MAG: hypothetical protein FRX48_06661 [Lasallia pustulata]